MNAFPGPLNEEKGLEDLPMPTREQAIEDHIGQLATTVAAIDEQITKAIQHREMLMHVIRTLDESRPIRLEVPQPEQADAPR